MRLGLVARAALAALALTLAAGEWGAVAAAASTRSTEARDFLARHGLDAANTVGDLACACRSFTTPATGWRASSLLCDDDAAGWRRRWRAAPLPLSRLAQLGAQVREEAEVQLGGVVARFFVSADQATLLVLFRHQEGEGPLDADMWEAMSLFGRNFVNMQLGAWAAPGTLLSALSSLVQQLIFAARRAAGLSYLPLARTLLDAVRAGAPPSQRLLLSGFSMGGALAQLLSLQTGAPALTFASNGVRDLALSLYALPFDASDAASNVLNLFDQDDFVPRMDCQVGAVCWYAGAAAEPACARQRETGVEEATCSAHRRTIFGADAPAAWDAWREAPQGVQCAEGRAAWRVWNAARGFCAHSAAATTAL